MSALIREHDWSSSTLGPPEHWPQSLCSTVDMMLSNKTIMFVAWGPDLTFLYNDAYIPVFGKRHPGALARPFREVWPEVWDEVEPLVNAALAGRATWSENLHLVLERNGYPEDCWFTFSYSPLRNQDGEVAGLFCAASETTDTVLTERRLKDQAQRQRQLFQKAPGFIAVLTGPEHVFEFVNDAYVKLAGGRDTLGLTVREVFPEIGSQGFYEVLDTVYATGNRYVAEGRVVALRDTHEGPSHDVVLDFIYEPIRDEAGSVTGIFVEGHNVTESHRTQAGLRKSEEKFQVLNETLERRVEERTTELVLARDALRQSQKLEAMGQLTGGVAHDFNNLLTPIIGSLDLLIRRGVGSERERRLIDGAMQSAERAKILVQRLLAFARRQPLQPIAVDIPELVEGMVALLGSTLGPTIDIQVLADPHLPPAKADSNQLEMGLLNLAVNARDAMPQGGKITIEVKKENALKATGLDLVEGEYIRLSVIDTGVGMDEATRQRAIEPFFSTKGIGRGTGLGLSMVHGLLAQLGGGMTIDSSPGKGTSIELWLPTSTAAFELAETFLAVPAPSQASRGLALLVDDEELVRMSTADMLIDLGFEVLEAGSAEEALQLISAGTRFALLVTDHLMPGMTGVELVHQVHLTQPMLPALIVSGYAEADGIAPDLPRLTKPFRNAELAECISVLVGNPEQHWVA